MKQILIVVNSWYRVMTGGDYHIFKVAQYWSRDHKISYLLPRLAYSSVKELMAGDAVVIESPFENKTSNIWMVALLYCVRIFKVVLSPPPVEKYDIIVASNHWLTDVLPAAYLQSKNPRCKLVAYYHGLTVKKLRWWRHIPRKLNDVLSLAVLRRYFDVVFVSNQLVKDFLIAQGVCADKIQFANYGTDPVPTKVNSKKPPFDACYVGRLVESKGILDLVAIWKEVVEEIPHAKLAIVGGGSDRDRLVRRIETERMQQHIELCGFVAESKKFEILLNSKLFLMPSYADDWGIAILEALSCGVPAVVYDFPALRSVWGDDVTYVPAGDTKSFAQTVLRLLRDPLRCSELASKGLKRSTKHLWENVARYEGDIIENL